MTTQPVAEIVERTEMRRISGADMGLGCSDGYVTDKWKEAKFFKVMPEDTSPFARTYNEILPVGTKLYAEPSGWIKVIDKEFTACHLGSADEYDSYEQAAEKLSRLIQWHIDVATDPAVNGGFQLVPVEPTEEMCKAGWKLFSSGVPYGYKAMLAAAPKHGETK